MKSLWVKPPFLNFPATDAEVYGALRYFDITPLAMTKSMGNSTTFKTDLSRYHLVMLKSMGHSTTALKQPPLSLH